MKNTIYIWDGGVFSPPTRAVGKLAYNIAIFMSEKYKKYNIEYHFVPTNKYYNKPWVRCVDEDDRIKMLNNLVEYINNEYKVPKNIKFIVNSHEIKLGKKRKQPITTNESINYIKNKSNLFLTNDINNLISRVKGNRTNGLELLFKVKTICYDIFSTLLVGENNSEKNVYNNIDLKELLKQSENKYPKQISDYFSKQKITSKQINEYLNDDKYVEKMEPVKNLIMDQIIFLPKKLVPEMYKASAGNRVREELDVYYSSLDNLKKYLTPNVNDFLTKNELYKHCKSTYQSKLVSKNKTSKKNKTKGKTKSSSRKIKSTRRK